MAIADLWRSQIHNKEVLDKEFDHIDAKDTDVLEATRFRKEEDDDDKKVSLAFAEACSPGLTLFSRE